MGAFSRPVHKQRRRQNLFTSNSPIKSKGDRAHRKNRQIPAATIDSHLEKADKNWYTRLPRTSRPAKGLHAPPPVPPSGFFNFAPLRRFPFFCPPAHPSPPTHNNHVAHRARLSCHQAPGIRSTTTRSGSTQRPVHNQLLAEQTPGPRLFHAPPFPIAVSVALFACCFSFATGASATNTPSPCRYIPLRTLRFLASDMRQT